MDSRRYTVESFQSVVSDDLNKSEDENNDDSDSYNLGDQEQKLTREDVKMNISGTILSMVNVQFEDPKM